MKEFFDNLADKWDDDMVIESAKIKKILDICDVSKGHSVIDIACGTGVLFEYLLERAPSLLAGVDFSEKMTHRARSKHSDDRIIVTCQDFLQCKNTKFDRAVLYNAYPHFFDKEMLAKKMHNVLKIGGRFVLAHGQGRQRINSHHKGENVRRFSIALKSAQQEKKWFEPFFDIDTIIDTSELYIISGSKKQPN